MYKKNNNMKKLETSEIISIISEIRNETEKYIIDNNLKSIVIGVSGGIDSALVCALLKPVCDKLEIPLIGRSISIETNTSEEKTRAKNIGNSFCTDFSEVDLTNEFIMLSNIDRLEGLVDDPIKYKFRMGNIKARMRMIYLYNLAARTGGIVMGTENLTEHYLGFCTLYGDSGTDFEPIIGLWKTEVYQLSEYLLTYLDAYKSAHLLACINANATDGLGISSTDLDQILPDWRERHQNTKGGYEEVDDIFKKYFKQNLSEEEQKELEDNPVIKRYINTNFKRNHPYKIKLKTI